MRYNFYQSIITEHGNDCINHAWAGVSSNSKLVQQFDEEWPLMMNNDVALVGKYEIRDTIRDTLISKVFHARLECELKLYRQNNTDRGVDHQGQFTLREYLKVMAGTGGVGGRGKSENAGDLEEEECKEDEQNNNEIEVDGRRRKVAKHVHITDSIRKLFFNSSEM